MSRMWLIFLSFMFSPVLAADDVLMYEPSGSSGETPVWSAGWYYTNQWNSGTGGQPKSYAYCHQSSSSVPLSWLSTDFINVKDSTLVHFTVTFKMYSCITSTGLPDCTETFDLHQYQRDSPAGGGGGGDTTNPDLAKPDKYPGNFPFVRTIRGTKFRPNSDTVSVSVPVTKKGAYFAIKATGGCYAIQAVKVTFQSCPENVINLVKFNKTKTQSQSVSVPGECVQGASSSQSLFFLECQANGTWNLFGSTGAQCKCNPGFQNNQGITACEACPVDQYKVVSGNTKCTACPGNSWTRNVTGHTWCVCKDGFYRAPWESTHVQCSALPSAPRNLSHSVDKTSVTLYWTTPISTGSRDDVYYLVSCLSQRQGVLYKPSSNVTATLVTVSGLTPFTNHTLTVTALNGVASEDNRNYWLIATVHAQTKQAGPWAPVIDSANSTHDTVFLSWRMRSRLDCLACSYEICYYTAGESCQMLDVPFPTSHVTVRGLQAGTRHFVKVRLRCCINDLFGEWSIVVSVRTYGEGESRSLLLKVSPGLCIGGSQDPSDVNNDVWLKKQN